MNKFYLSLVILMVFVFESNTSAGLRQAGNAARNTCRNVGLSRSALKTNQRFAAQRPTITNQGFGTQTYTQKFTPTVPSMNLYCNPLKQKLAQKWQSISNDLRSAAQTMSKYTQNLSSGVKDTAGVVGITAAGLLACNYKKNAPCLTNSAELTPEDITQLQEERARLRTLTYEAWLKHRQDALKEQREELQKEYQDEIDATIQVTSNDKQAIENLDELIKNQVPWYHVIPWLRERKFMNKVKKERHDLSASVQLMDERIQAIRDSEQEELNKLKDKEQNYRNELTKEKDSLPIDRTTYFLQPKVKGILIERIMLASKYPELDPFSVTLVHVVDRNPDGSIQRVREGDISELNSEQLEQIKKGHFIFKGYAGSVKTAVTGHIRHAVPMIIIDSKTKISENDLNRICRSAPMDRYGTDRSLDPERGARGEYIERIYPYTPEEQQERIKEFETLRERSNEKFQALEVIDPEDFNRLLATSVLSKEALEQATRNDQLCNALENNAEPQHIHKAFKDVENNKAHTYDVAKVRSLKKLMEKRNETKTHNFFEQAADQN